MKTIFSILSFLFILFSVGIKAQQVSFENINSNNVLNLLSQMSTIQQDNITTSIVSQIGNQNYAELNINKGTDVRVLQNGDYNYLNFDNSFESKPTKSTITAEGNNNIIDITGSNSISEKIQIHVQGDNKTIFMRNY